MSLETVPRHWFGNDPWITHWMNAILAAVPDGERWVMQATRKQLDDPLVRQGVIGFIRQEQTHSREHDAMNDAMVAHGIPMDRAEAVFKVVRQTLQRYLGDTTRCAMAATARCIEAARERDATCVEIRQDAHDRYFQNIQRRQQGTVFVNHNCAASNSYYFDRHGDAPMLRPSTSFEMLWRAKHLPMKHYRFQHTAAPGQGGKRRAQG